MRFDPSAPMHDRYVVDRDFLAPELEWRGGDDQRGW